ncbi:MAG TPA: RNA 2',3'-cyclic phosphodiesterase [Solirubrobacteraceae bacterium]|nr:RNA 2',3'-cyclic phosphodiesterase [Solirubrobacteraceae bacterium]
MRLFVALDLPVPTRAALATWADATAPPELRRVRADNLHVTLSFLGERSVAEAVTVGPLLKPRRLGPLHTAGALWLPPRRPGVLAVALRKQPALTALQRDLTAALEDAIGLAPDRHRFRPHVTLARVPRGTRVDRELRALDPPPPLFSFQAPSLTLYHSWQGPDGLRYDPVARIALR